METIRYTKRICQDQTKIERFLTKQRAGTLSMIDRVNRPYGIPVNYVYWNGRIYFHGLGSGKKNDIFAVNPLVCFSIFEEFGTVVDPVPAKCDTAYMSVVLFGKVLPVEDLAEKTQVLAEILSKFTPGYFKQPLAGDFVAQYRSSFDNKAVSVYCMIPEEITAKENPLGNR